MKKYIEPVSDLNDLTSTIDRSEIRLAVEKLLEDAHKAALGQGEFGTYEDVFGNENNNE